MNNEIRHLKNGDFEVVYEKPRETRYGPITGTGRRAVHWLVGDRWEHKGWLMAPLWEAE